MLRRNCPFVNDVMVSLGYCASIAGVSVVHSEEIGNLQGPPVLSWGEGLDLISLAFPFLQGRVRLCESSALGPPCREVALDTK